MDSELWNQILLFYKEEFSIDSKYVNLMSVIDILILSVSGVSNSGIANSLDIDDDVVKSAIEENLDPFCGWASDLESNPLYVYGSTSSKEEFSKTLTKSGLSKPDIDKAYTSCLTLSNLLDSLSENWK